MTHDTASPPRKTLTERLDALTGHHEAAIEDQFGHDVYDTWDAFMEALDDDRVSRKANARLLRMLLFVDKLTDGLPPKLAYTAVMDLPLAEVNTELGIGGDLDEGPAGQDDAGQDAGNDQTPSPDGESADA